LQNRYLCRNAVHKEKMVNNKKIKLIVVDDQPHFREGLKTFVQNELDYEVLADVGSGTEFLSLYNIGQTDIILMDIEMPELNGMETSKKILWQYPHLKIIAITMYKDKAYLKELIEAGIKGFVHKTSIYNDIEDAIKNVMENNLHFPPDINLGT